jgi:hypothetical protein
MKNSFRVACTLAVFVASGCSEPTLPRVNPNDEFGAFELRIVASRDTVSGANPLVVLRLVSEPQFAGYTPTWTSSPTGVLIHDGNGVFRAISGPATSVLVTARFLGNTASYTLYRIP